MAKKLVRSIKALVPLLKSPPVVMLAISLVLLLISMAAAHRVRPYISDDVSWQVALMHWTPFGGDLALGSSDNMVLKLPFFMVMEQLFPAGRKLLFLEAAVLAMLGFTMFYAAGVYFLKKAKVALTYRNLLPFVWLASFGFAMAQLYLNPIWRTFDIGLMFLLFMLVAMVYYGDVRPLQSIRGRLAVLLVTILYGVAIYSDPYYLYFAIGPVLLFTAGLLLLKKVTIKSAALVFGGAVLALIFAKVTELISEAAGIRMTAEYPIEFVTFDNFFSNIGLAIHGILVMFGADFFGQRSLNLVVIGAIIALAIITYIAYLLRHAIRGLILERKAGQLTLTRLWMLFFAGLVLLNIVLYTFSTMPGNDLHTYRYFIVLTFAAVLFLALSMQKKMQAVLTVVFIVSIIANIAVSIAANQRYIEPGTVETVSIGQPSSVGNRANAQNYEIISALESRGYSKGYADFWHGVINTYLSQGRVEVLPVACKDGDTNQRQWLVDTGRFSVKTDKSFYIHDPELTRSSACSYEQVLAQFGEPVEIVAAGGKMILLYDHDIL